MTDTANPFEHPARARLAELIDQAEEQILEEQAAQPLHDPLERYHVAEEWGVEPWVAAMIEAARELATLKALATSAISTPGEAKDKLLAVTTKTLQAAVLAEETDHADAALDDTQLAAFLEKLAEQLDQRIARLRAPATIQEDAEPGPLTQPRVQDPHKIPAKLAGEDPDVSPGLAFTAAHPAVVAGEGPVQDPAARMDSGDEHDGFLNHGDEQMHAHDGHRGLHIHEGWNLVTWTPGHEPFDPAQVAGHEDPQFMAEHTAQIREEQGRDLIRPEEVDPATAGQSHDFARVDDQDPDPGRPWPEERALVRETVALRRSAAGSSAAQLGGRHVSDASTDPDMGATGRRARGEEA